MSYLVLARKYRPGRFAEVLGQDVTTDVLRGAIREGRIGHAYLFSGPRGTGKTTTARIFAKALNCERGPAEDPCGECERCRSADSGAEVDIVEIDAASNTQVDFIRDLRDQAAYAPMRARHKIYIIDEVHMLSKAAFNALLKTLEEPPPHVKFLFATTELHKVPDTILSRCQVMRLAPIAEAVIMRQLADVFEREGVEAEEGVTEELARRARGGMRDALSLADQLLALVGSAPTVADLARLSGDAGGSAIERVIEALENGDRAAVLRALPDRPGTENELLAGLLDELRGALLCAACGAGVPVLQADERARERMEALGRRLGPDRLELFLQELLAARERMQLLPGQARIVFEIALLDLCRPEIGVPIGELLRRLDALEERLGGLSDGLPEGADRGSRARPLPRGAAAPSGAAPASARSEVPEREGVRSPDSPGGGPRGSGPSGDGPRAQASDADPPAVRAASETASDSAAAASGSATATAPAPAGRTRGKPGPASAPRPRSTAEAWSRFLEEVGGDAASLASVLRERGKLVELAPPRAVVKLSALRQSERAMVTDARNVKLCNAAFSRAAGEDIDVTLEDSAASRPGHQDPFTREVADLFGGRIEDDP